MLKQNFTLNISLKVCTFVSSLHDSAQENINIPRSLQMLHGKTFTENIHLEDQEYGMTLWQVLGMDTEAKSSNLENKIECVKDIRVSTQNVRANVLDVPQKTK